jgi:hypothetical protein
LREARTLLSKAPHKDKDIQVAANRLLRTLDR